MRKVNLQQAELESGSDRPGFVVRRTRLADPLGATRIGGSLYELDEGQQLWPYHYHHGVEEWLLVVAGAPTLRTPDGEQLLRAGDCVCFPTGPEGAHTLRGAGRVLMLSTGTDVSISVYPDSGKLSARPGVLDDSDRLNFRRADAVDYWDGE